MRFYNSALNQVNGVVATPADAVEAMYERLTGGSFAGFISEFGEQAEVESVMDRARMMANKICHVSLEAEMNQLALKLFGKLLELAKLRHKGNLGRYRCALMCTTFVCFMKSWKQDADSLIAFEQYIIDTFC